MSKSLIHIRMSDMGNCLHEHEIFEMMKSRPLYQMQFDLRRKLEKRIRAIELAEKVHISTFQSKKTVFLNKMREKIRQKNLRRYSKEVMENSNDKEERELFTTNDNIEENTENAKERDKEKVQANLSRSKSLIDILNQETEDKSERPVTSRSVVSLNGKSFPVSKSSARKRIPDRALVTEVTMYPTDFISQISAENFVSEPNKVSIKDKTQESKICSTTKDIKFNVNYSTYERNKPATLPSLNTSNDVVKSLATFEMGTLTPEGRLLLTRDDYNNYMCKFQRKREKRLRRVRKLSEILEEKVQNFRIEED